MMPDVRDVEIEHGEIAQSIHNRVLEVGANFRSVAGKVQLRQVAR
jgi:hypothetical protein